MRTPLPRSALSTCSGNWTAASQRLSLINTWKISSTLAVSMVKVYASVSACFLTGAHKTTAMLSFAVCGIIEGTQLQLDFWPSWISLDTFHKISVLELLCIPVSWLLVFAFSNMLFPLVSPQHVCHRDLDRVADVMAISLRGKSSSSIFESCARRRANKGSVSEMSCLCVWWEGQCVFLFVVGGASCIGLGLLAAFTCCSFVTQFFDCGWHECQYVSLCMLSHARMFIGGAAFCPAFFDRCWSSECDVSTTLVVQNFMMVLEPGQSTLFHLQFWYSCEPEIFFAYYS